MFSIRFIWIGAAALLWVGSPSLSSAQSTPESGQPFDLGISLILDGIHFSALRKGNEEPAGFGHAHDHGHGHGHGHDHGFNEGFNLGHSELAFEARLGDVLDGVVLIGFDSNHIELEEAYVMTRSLPAGWQLTGGKFLSEIGYINNRHSHDWNFVDRPLVNEFLFGDHGLQDIGLRATYIPPTAWYTRFGLELLQGSGEGIDRFDSGVPVGRRDGPRIVTAFVKTGPDLGTDHAIQVGASAGYVAQYARLDDHGSHAHALEGDLWFGGVDATYKYDSGRLYGHGDWRITGEYFLAYRSVDEFIQQGHGDHPTWRRRDNHSERQDGVYLEAVYGFMPRWQLGLRAEALGLTNRVTDFHPTAVVSRDASYRYSAQVTFRPIEPVFLRGQLSYSDFATAEHNHDHGHSHDHGGDTGSGLALFFQVNIALGAHGAHRF